MSSAFFFYLLQKPFIIEPLQIPPKKSKEKTTLKFWQIFETKKDQSAKTSLQFR